MSLYPTKLAVSLAVGFSSLVLRRLGSHRRFSSHGSVLRGDRVGSLPHIQVIGIIMPVLAEPSSRNRGNNSMRNAVDLCAIRPGRGEAGHFGSQIPANQRKVAEEWL